MRYNLVTLFPEWFDSPLGAGLMGKAVNSGLLDFYFANPRDFAADRHRSVDDRPYGGGPGMVMLLEPLCAAIRSIPRPGRIIVLTPSGRPLDQALAAELASEDALTLVCGRYEGFDSRLFAMDFGGRPPQAVCLGDFVLNGGETAALALIEATARLLPGFMGKCESGDEESFSAGLLEYPHFTRPEIFEGHGVPEVLLGGDHAKIALWRHEQAILQTAAQRPDLLPNYRLTYKDRELIAAQPRFWPGKNLYLALLHHPVLLKNGQSGTSSLTNLDIHDIARISRSYGLGGFFVVTPLQDQRGLLDSLILHWTSGPGGAANPDRREALELVRPAESLAEVCEYLQGACAFAPYLVGSSARPLLNRKGREKFPVGTFGEIRQKLNDTPVLLLLGTSHGLAPEVLEMCQAMLPPLRWAGNYNHLPVRAAAAIMLDRLLCDLG